MDSDSTLIGMNVSETSQLDIYLENQKIEKMVMFPKSTGTLYPLFQIPQDKKKLGNFVWFDYLRPRSKADVFRWQDKKAGDVLKKNVRGPIELPNQHLFDKRPAQNRPVAQDSMSVPVPADTTALVPDTARVADPQSINEKKKEE